MSKQGRYENKVGGRKGRKVLLTVVIVLALLIFGAVGAVALYANSLVDSMNHVDITKPVYTEPATQPQSAEETTQPLADAGEATAATEPEVIYDREDFQNFLVVCKPVSDGSVRKTDTMILCTLNTKARTITMTSLLENVVVEASAYKWYKGGTVTLDSVYGMGAVYGNGTAGSMEMMNQTLYDNFGIEIDENFEIDMKIFAKMVARLGSVEISLSEDEANYLSEATGKEIADGNITMDGDLALEYVKMWNAEDAQHISSIKSQRKLAEAIVQRIRTQYDTDLEAIVKDFMPSVTTSMNYAQFKEFLMSMLPMMRTLAFENGGTCPVSFTEAVMDVDGDGEEETVLTFDAAQAKKEMRALTLGEK